VQRRILLVAVTAVALAVTVLGVPLAFVQKELLRESEQGRLYDAAITFAVEVKRSIRDTDKPPEIPGDLHGIRLSVYDEDGRLLAGDGPRTADDLVQEALEGEPSKGFVGDNLVAAVPVESGGEVIAVTRAFSYRKKLRQQELITFAAIAGVAVFASLMALLLALRLAVRLAEPIRDLQRAAEELGDGNFAVQAPTSGIGELDAVAVSMNATAQRLGELVSRERAFSAHASHQLRTPLTALRLRLDSAADGGTEDLRTAITESIAIVDDLEATVHDLLAVSRGRTGAAATLDLDALLHGLPHRWQGLLKATGRDFVIRTDDPPTATGRSATVRQVLDVLIDNAYRHGAGLVQVVARDASGALAIDVVDEGRPGSAPEVDAQFGRISAGGRSGSIDRLDGDAARGRGCAVPPPSPASPRRGGGTGIGLGLARSLLVADGGRLLLSSTPGRTCATVLLPGVDPG
jgi:signal transduction histidine kinase